MINQSIHTKGSIYRFTLAMLMVLSIFSVSGSIGLSSFWPQKVGIELVLTAGQKSTPHSVYYYSFSQKSNTAQRYVYQLQKQHKYAALRFSELLTTQFDHQSIEFLGIKPVVQQIHSSVQVLKLHYESSFA